MFTPILNGFSGSCTDTAGVDKVIAALNEYGLNTYRIAANPSWITGGTRPWKPEHVDYFLAHCNHYIIVDRNHIFPPSGTLDWVKAEASIFSDVLAKWGNNPRVLVEIVNEYYGLDLAAKCQGIITRIRAAGYQNMIVQNNQPHGGTQPWINYDTAYDPLSDKVFQGMHQYFNQNSIAGAKWNLQGTGQAISKGITNFCNTEVGAHASESANFTTANVVLLNEWLVWCKTMNIGNCVWMNHDVDNLATYKTLGLKFPVAAPPPPPNPCQTYIDQIKTLNDKLTVYMNQIAGLDEDIDLLQTTVANQMEVIDSLNAQISALSIQNAGLKSKLDTIRATAVY